MKTTSRLSTPAGLRTLLVLIVALVAAVAVPSGTARAAAGQLTIGRFGMVILTPPSGGEVSVSLQNAFPGSTFVRMRVDWGTLDTRVQQLRISGMPGAPVNGFDLNNAIFEPQPRQPDQIILNVHPPERTFSDTFIVELSRGMGVNGVIGQIALLDLTSGEQRSVDNIPVVFDPVATSDAVDLTSGGTQSGGITLVAGGALTGGNGASVTGTVTALPGSSVQVTQGQLTLGDGSAPVKLAGQVDVQPNTTLKLNSSTKVELSGQTTVNQGAIDASSGMLIGSPEIEQQMNDLMAQLHQEGVAQRAAAQAARVQQRADELKRLQDQASQLQLNAEMALLKAAMTSVVQIGAGVIGVAGAGTMKAQGTLVGNVNVAGTLTSGDTQQLDRTDIQGDVKVASGAQLEMKSAGTGSGQTDKLTVSGDVIFNTGAILKLRLLALNGLATKPGVVSARTIDAFDPADAETDVGAPQFFDEFDILTAQHITNQGIIVDAPAFPDRAFIVGIYDNPDGTQTLRLIVVPYSDIPLDTSTPTASPTQSPAANAAGWNTADVTVDWNWSDTGAGIDAADCTTSSASSGEGMLTLSATCTDLAGNQGSATYAVKVDATPPTLDPLVRPNPVQVGAPATVAANAQDARSGIATVSCAALDSSTPGTNTVTCTATDVAGNQASASAPYTVYAATNTAPTVAIARGGSCVSSVAGRIALAVGDAEQAVSILTLSATSSNPTLLPATNVVFDGSGAQRSATLTAAAGRTGRAVLTLTVRDGSTSASTTVTAIVGGSGNDALVGTDSADVLLAQGGNDVLQGKSGIDLLCGDTGNDALDAAAGDDTLVGGAGNDALQAGAGNDSLHGGDGNDALNGAEGDDLLSGGTGADAFNGGTGTDSAADYNAAQGDSRQNIP